jgi:lactoylglutathione lyase
MAIRVKSVSIYVSDQDKAINFYTNKLGFEKRADTAFGEGNRWVEVVPPGSDLAFILVRGFADWQEDRIGKFSGIVLEADDIKATYEEWKSRGVQFTESPTAQFYGLMQAQFVDQDGNQYVLVSREQPARNE